MSTFPEQLNALTHSQKNSSTVFKPTFYKLSRPSDLKAFTQLLAIPGIVVMDHIMGQITELVKLKSPHRRFSTDELKSETEKYINKRDLNEYGVWVYYSWSNRLVHILDEEEFIEVRTSRNQYKITREERDVLATKKIGVIGLSVGQSVSVTLAMERICGELRLADFDLLELTNLNRIRTGVHNLGLAKVYSVAREIAEIDPYIKISCFPEGLSEANLDEFFTRDGKLDLLVEESDGFDIKILSRYKARDLGVPVIMEASDKCMVDVERFDLEPDRKILHGIVKHLDVETLKTLTTNEEKIPYMLDVLGLSSTSPRLRASMLEMQQTISTWPQLGSAVTMGGGITADVSRRILLNHFTDSGRYYVDIDELIGNKIRKVETAVSDAENHIVLTLDKMLREANEQRGSEDSEIDATDLQKIVEAGVAAPSFANKQPWKWLSHAKKLFLFKDNKPGFLDHSERNIFVSLGAAIENVQLEAQQLGYEAHMDLLPVKADYSLVARFSFKKNKAAAKETLAPYIFERQTNRKPGNGSPVEPAALEELKQVVNEEGVKLELITSAEQIHSLAQIAGAVERIRLLHPQAHADYFGNVVRWSSGQSVTEGIDVKTLEMPAAVHTAFEVISDPKVAALLNQWEKGSAFEKLTQHSVSNSAAIGMLSVPDAGIPAWISGGRIAEKIWLTCTKNSLAFQPICLPLTFLNHFGNENTDKAVSAKTFYEIKALKAQLSLIFRDFETREAVFLFRLFQADKPQFRSLRKPLNEVYFKS